MSVASGKVNFAFELDENLTSVFEITELELVVAEGSIIDTCDLALTWCYDGQFPATRMNLVQQHVDSIVTWRPERKVQLTGNFESLELTICNEQNFLVKHFTKNDLTEHVVSREMLEFSFKNENDVSLIRGSAIVVQHDVEDELQQFNAFGQIQDYCWNLNTITDVTQALMRKNADVVRIPEDHLDKVVEYNKLGQLSLQLFRLARKLRDIDASISFFERAIALIEEHHPDKSFLRVQTLMLYHGSLSERYIVFAKSDDFQRMLSSQDDVIEILSEHHPITLMALTNKASLYLLRTQHSCDPNDADKAIELLVQATHHIHASGLGSVPPLCDLANCYRQRYMMTNNPRDIKMAIEYQSQVVDALPTDNPCHPDMMNNFAGLYLLRYRQTGDLSDFDLSTSIRKDLLNAMSENDSLFVDILCTLGNSFFRRFEHTKAIEDIDEAISLLKRGVDLTPEGNALKPRRLTDFGNLYLERAKFTTNPDDCDKSMECFRRALDITPEGHPESGFRMVNLISALEQCFIVLGDLKDIDEAISLRRQYIETAVLNDSASRLHNLSRLFSRRFSKSNDLSDMREAIAAQRQALDLTSTADENYAIISKQLLRLQHDLAIYTKSIQDIDTALEFGEYVRPIFFTPEIGIHGRISQLWQLRFRSSGSLSDIDHAIENQRDIVRLTDGPVHTNVLGGLLLTRYRVTKSIKDVNEAIEIFGTSLSMTPSGLDDSLINICRMGKMLVSSYDKTLELDYYHNGITLLEEAFRRCPSNHNLLPAIMGSLGSNLLKGFTQTGQLDYIEKSIDILERASEYKSSASDNDNEPYLPSLGEALRIRFENTGNRSDLERSIQLLQKAIQGGLESIKPQYYDSLGTSLLRLYLLDGNQTTLEDAVILLRRAIETSGDTSDKHMHLSHLGNALLRRFELTGQVEDIDEAISLQQQAVQATLGSQSSLLINTINLGNAYKIRFDADGSKEDITEAIAVYRNALSLANKERGETLAMVYDNLATALLSYFPLDKDPQILLEGIDLLEESMKIVTYDHPFKPIQLNTLANIYRRRYESTGELEHLETTINILKDVSEHPAKTQVLGMIVIENLTWAYERRFERLNDPSDIDLMISSYEGLLGLIPETQVKYTQTLRRLAMTLELRGRHTDNQEDFSRAIGYHRSIAENTIIAPVERFRSATSWARALRLMHDPISLDGYSLAIELLQMVAWLGDKLTERHEKLSSNSQLTNEAAAAAFYWNRPDLALRWLEEGRNIVWKQLSAFRTPIDDLNDAHPELAGEITRISNELDRLSSQSSKQLQRRMSLEQKVNEQAQVRERRDLANQWKRILATIRVKDGFEDFLRPTDVSKYNEMDRPDGTVIVINVAKERCDALVLRRGHKDNLHIPLVKFTYDKAESLRKTLVMHLTKSGIRSRGGRLATRERFDMPFEDILIQLWVCVVNPILTALEIKPAEDPQRVWWCATGPLAFLPLHAAGIYTGQGAGIGSIASDYVISSYIPTLSTLFSRGQHKAPIPLEKMLLVTQPETPHMAPLPATIEEGNLIKEVISASGVEIDFRNDKHATVDKVVEAMESCNWIHLACHAIQNPKNPTKSGFYLHDGILEMSMLIAKPLPRADFAFLSACETGTGDEKLPEEAVHLAAGLLQAGYRSVVATMWAIDDVYAPMVSERFYSILLDKANPPNDEDAAYALQEAAKDVRKKLGDTDASFLTWVPFIHFGI